MNNRLKLALTCILAAAATAPTYGANLLDVYHRAQQSDPLLREADQTRLAAREGKPQSLAALLPTIAGSASLGKTDAGTDFSGIRLIGTTPIPGSGRSDSSTTSRQWGVQLQQSVFHWDQWANLRRANSQVAQAEATYLAAKQDLIARVTQSYFNVLAAKDTLDATTAAAEAYGRQLEQIDKRFEVGLVAITDVQDARAARDRATADVISAKRAVSTNEELLREITGEPMGNLSAPGDDMPLKSPEPAAEERWVATAMDQNLALIAARLNADIASESVSAARAGHLPSLDLVGSRTKGTSDGDSTASSAPGKNFPSSSDTTTTSVSLQLSVPIFSGGAVQSRVRQAVYTYRAARERVERVSRETERGARDNYLGVASNIARVQALKQAFESSQTALQATEAGYEVGTRTTVDVLLSRQNLYSTQTQYLKSKYDYIQSVVQLKQAAGTLSEQDVAEINSWLK